MSRYLAWNRTTRKVYDQLHADDYMIQIVAKREKSSNSKDFEIQVGYIIMDMVSREKEFFDVDRSEIDIAGIAQEMF